jgi:hypothetical protein
LKQALARQRGNASPMKENIFSLIKFIEFKFIEKKKGRGKEKTQSNKTKENKTNHFE